MFRFKRILVPLDGSASAEAALDPAIKLAQVMSAEITLLKVVPTFRLVAPFVHVDYPLKDAQEHLQQQARSYLKAMSMMRKGEGVVFQSSVVTGRAAAATIKFIRENDIDLLVMTSHGGSGIGRWRYGAVAMKLLLGAPVSTLVVRSDKDHQPLRFARMLLPLDGSEAAEKALEPAVAIARLTGSEAILLGVTAPIQKAVGAESAQALAPQVQSQVADYLQAVRAKWAEAPFDMATQVETGPIAQSILDYAQAQRADLIALSTHGASGATELPLGGTADKIVRGARRAVLLVRP